MLLHTCLCVCLVFSRTDSFSYKWIASSVPSYTHPTSGHRSCCHRRNPRNDKSHVPWLAWACIYPGFMGSSRGGRWFIIVTVAGAVMLQLNRVTTDHAARLCLCVPRCRRYRGLARTCCREEKPACRCFAVVQGISVLLSSCCVNCLNVAALIKFPVEDFRTTFAYSYLDIIGKKDHLC